MQDNEVIVKQYCSLIEHADRVLFQRNERTKHFLTINSAIITGISYLIINNTSLSLTIFILAFGILLNWIWIQNIDQYACALKRIWQQITFMEEMLPCSPHKDKWDKLCEDGYKTADHYEKKIPFAIMLLYIIATLYETITIIILQTTSKSIQSFILQLLT